MALNTRSRIVRTIGALTVVVAGAAFAAPVATATPSGAVPKNFKAQSIDWVTPQHGFVLGTGRCAPKPCSDLISTTDGGATWSLVGSLPMPVERLGQRKPVGVTEVRFATDQVGWAYGPLLAKTDDGGQTWSSIPLPGDTRQILSLDTNAHGAYAVMSSCRFGHGFCKKQLTFWHTWSSGDSWKQIPLDLPVNTGASVSVFKRSVYVADNTLFTGGDEDKVYASTDGRHFENRPSPCEHADDLAITQVVATSKSDVSELCVGDPGFSKAVKTVYRSTDNGQTLESAGQAGLLGIQSQLAASRSGNLAIASQSDGSFIYVNNTGGTDWTMPVGLGDGGIGWNDIVFTTNKVAWVVYAPAGGFEPQGVLYVTRDAGDTWTPAPF